MKKQIGTYFFILGVFFLMLYAASVKADQSIPKWFLAGITLTAIGGILWRRGSQRSADERFFRTWRKLRTRKKKKGNY